MYYFLMILCLFLLSVFVLFLEGLIVEVCLLLENVDFFSFGLFFLYIGMFFDGDDIFFGVIFIVYFLYYFVVKVMILFMFEWKCFLYLFIFMFFVFWFFMKMYFFYFF